MIIIIQHKKSPNVSLAVLNVYILKYINLIVNQYEKRGKQSPANIEVNTLSFSAFFNINSLIIPPPLVYSISYWYN